MYLCHGCRKQANKLEPLPHLILAGEGGVAVQDVVVQDLVRGGQQLLAPGGNTTAVQEAALCNGSVPGTVIRYLDGYTMCCIQNTSSYKYQPATSGS